MFFFHYPGVTLVVDVNQCLEKENRSDILSVLKSSVYNTNEIFPECADRYYDALAKKKEQKSESGKHFHHLAQTKYSFEYDIISVVMYFLHFKTNTAFK